MHFTSFLAVLPLVGLAVAQQNLVVKVGDAGALTFTPPSITINDGDSVSFQFLSKNHTVTQSTFASPCSPMTNADGTPGIDSGFQFVDPAATQVQQFTFTVNNATAPLWFYCRQKTPADHCTAGMVFAINPTAEKSFDAFQAAAKASASNTTATSASAGATGATSAPGGTAATGATSAGGATSTDSALSPSATTTSDAGSAKAGSAAGLLVAGIALVAGSLL
ncbi:unnamed protein product [Somion occarium]|uniref:Cupredoxin n=1 Tax=Somion occarium TaxID=3059160 RepID=A0ABP1DE46_9APHY